MLCSCPPTLRHVSSSPALRQNGRRVDFDVYALPAPSLRPAGAAATVPASSRHHPPPNKSPVQMKLSRHSLAPVLPVASSCTWGPTEAGRWPCADQTQCGWPHPLPWTQGPLPCLDPMVPVICLLDHQSALRDQTLGETRASSEAAGSTLSLCCGLAQ